MNQKPNSLLQRIASVLFTAALILVGPTLMMTSYQQVDADEELARTGVQVTGTITYFSDARKASNRAITVEYMAADGVSRYANAPVDHEQHPSVGRRSPSRTANKTRPRLLFSAMKAAASFSAVWA